MLEDGGLLNRVWSSKMTPCCALNRPLHHCISNSSFSGADTVCFWYAAHTEPTHQLLLPPPSFVSYQLVIRVPMCPGSQ